MNWHKDHEQGKACGLLQALIEITGKDCSQDYEDAVEQARTEIEAMKIVYFDPDPEHIIKLLDLANFDGQAYYTAHTEPWKLRNT